MINDGILYSVKKGIGIVDIDDTTFDDDIITHINSVFMILNQLGVGPTSGFSIEDGTKRWSDYLPQDFNMEGVKTYIILRVKTIFDPHSTSFTQEAAERQIKELEWRISSQVELNKPPSI